MEGLQRDKRSHTHTHTHTHTHAHMLVARGLFADWR